MRRFALGGLWIARSFHLERSGFRIREPFSTTSRASIQYRKWTAAEDKKIRDLQKQNLSVPEIAAQLQDRKATQVQYRLRRLRDEEVRFRSSREPWSESEDMIIVQQRLKGMPFRQIENFLPGRNWPAIAVRHRQLKNDVSDREKKTTPWTEEEKQAIVDMKVNRKLSTFAIAQNLKRSYMSVQIVWGGELRPQLSKETIDSLRPSNGWTAEQDEILRDLHRKGVRFNRMVIPGKTLKAIYTRSAMLSLAPTKRARPSPAQAMAMRHALKRVLAGEATLEEVHEQFPDSPRLRFTNMLHRLRTGSYKQKDRP